MMPSNDSQILIFQDELEKNEHSEDPSLVFFELANADTVGYRLPSFFFSASSSTNQSVSRRKQDDERKNSLIDSTLTKKSIPSDVLVQVRQNSKAQTHTGGVVWETSYLLLGYLLHQRRRRRRRNHCLGKVVEVGAGCGLLGIALAVAGCAKEVIATEVDIVMPLLQENVKRNQSLLRQSQNNNNDDNNNTSLRACPLDWTRFRKDAEAAGLAPHSVDTILGTDVVFSPSLVEPLWETLQYLSHAKTIVYLCVQIRCAASHELLLAKASVYGFVMEQILKNDDESDSNDDDDNNNNSPLPSWATDLECFLFRITRIPGHRNDDEDNINKTTKPLHSKERQTKRRKKKHT